MTPRDVITIKSDSDEDEDLRHAIALSLQDQNSTDQETAAICETEREQNATVSDQVAFGSIALNRKAMEEDRLKRLKKRHRNSNENRPEEPPTKRLAKQQSLGHGRSEPQYPYGAVRRTWACGFPKMSDDITIEEVFQKDELQLALLSSYQWDEEWLLSKLNAKTRILLLAFAENEEQKEQMKANVPKNIRFCFPPMHGPGSMHSKLQLLKYPNYLRLVIPTGNLVSHDWGETGVMENMVFLIDLPRLETDGGQELPKFGKDIAIFLEASGVDDTMVKSLANYNFSATQKLGFVYSIPGGHSGNALHRVGYCGLGATVRDLGLATDAPVEVDLACASLGSVNCDLVNAIYNACQGDNGMQEYNRRINRKAGCRETRPSQELRDNFRIYFPTDQTVGKSKGGREAAGTICVQAKWWNSTTFPRELVYDCVNTRSGLLMHSKIIFVGRKANKETTEPAQARWAYIGSANLSESAWGRVVRDKGTGNAKMSCRNWECGVVVPTKVPVDNGLATAVPVPMEVPGRRYGPGEEPWFFQGNK